MNSFKSITYTLFRRFSTRRMTRKRGLARRRECAGIEGKIQIEKTIGEANLDLDEIDVDDLNEYESDFMNVGMSHIMHKREMAAAKQRLKERIVAQKYFKNVEPSFLTFIEKDQIQKLHKANPEEWTIERLSESFPALPDTIRKILRSKWVPKTVETVLKYDEKVKQNWDDFRSNKLAVSPALTEHLMKFKDRKISLTDRHIIAERLVPPKFEPPKPKSKVFRSIIEGYLEQENSIAPAPKLIASSESTAEKNNELVSTEKKDQTHTQTAVVHKEHKQEKYTEQQSSSENQQNRNVSKNASLTFNEFIKERLEKIYQKSSQEGIVLMDMYRKQIEAANNENSNQSSAPTLSKDASDVNSISWPKNKNKKTNAIIKKTDSSSVDTYIKEWNKKTDTELTYARRIKIPKNVYKEGMTYRIKDCYYDDDGEFLYRTPGLRS